MLTKHRVSRVRGFTLLEVMIALIVLSVGLLGIVKLESATIASTTVAAKRSLAALEGDSLAAMMHVNRGYWISTDASGATISVTGTTVTVTAGAAILTTSVASVQAGTTLCNVAATPCAVADMAAYDLKQWAVAVNTLLPNYTAAISCGGSSVSCTINITWSENAVSVNVTETNSTTAAMLKPSYSLYVQP
jgi:type IV pilus assembly protein PilV